MSIYFKKGKGWRYDFILQGTRHTEAWFETKKAAKQAEARKKEEILNPEQQPAPIKKTRTDMAFLTLSNKRLDYVKQYHSEEHYRHVCYHVRRWIKVWKGLTCGEITNDMVEAHILKRSKISAYTANKDLRYLRALFNYGIKRKLIFGNPTDGIDFLPENRTRRYVPPKKDVLKVIQAADPDTQDYLWCILLTAARMNEINSLTWEDVNLEDRYVTLWTRKKRYGNREPRDIPMVSKLYDILVYRHKHRDPEKPWVFWHTYWDRKLKQKVSGPYKERKGIMTSLCKKAKVRHFRFHPFRHLTASILDDLGIPIGVIQRILGHENRSTTERYLHSIGEAERKAMNRLEEVDIFAAPLPENNDRPTNLPKEYWLRKANRSDYEALCKEIRQFGFVGTGKKYNVSDNAVRKWKKNYELQFEN